MTQVDQFRAGSQEELINILRRFAEIGTITGFEEAEKTKYGQYYTVSIDPDEPQNEFTRNLLGSGSPFLEDLSEPPGKSSYSGPRTKTVPTSEVRPLISEGVANKLIDAGFNEPRVKELANQGWTQESVDQFMNEARSQGITPPRDIEASLLNVTPINPITPQTRSLIPSGLGLLLGLGLILIGND